MTKLLIISAALLLASAVGRLVWDEWQTLKRKARDMRIARELDEIRVQLKDANEQTRLFWERNGDWDR